MSVPREGMPSLGDDYEGLKDYLYDLEEYDPDVLVDILELTSSDIIERFYDVAQLKYKGIR